MTDFKDYQIENSAVSSSRLAVVMTCHNRRAYSERAVRGLVSQGAESWDMAVFAVDDGSTDGTRAALEALGPTVRVLEGSGSLYWAGGMRLAIKHALEWNPGWLLWINDDVNIEPTLLERLHMRVEAQNLDRPSVIVGTVVDAETGQTTYGARAQSTRFETSFPLAGPTDAIASFNGNIVLFSRSALDVIGGFPQGYRHGYADFVSGLRASRAGVAIETLDRAGTDSLNPRSSSIHDPRTPLPQRIRTALSVHGMPPRDHLRFCIEAAQSRMRGWYLFFRSYARVVWIYRGS